MTLQQRTPVSLRHRASRRSLAGDLSGQEALGRGGVFFDRDRPALILATKLAYREPAPAANDRPNQVDAAVARRPLQQLECAIALLGRQAGERFWRAHHRA